MFRSLRGSTAAKNAPPPTVYTQPAFAGKKAFGGLPPPPIRRVSTSTPASAAHVPEPEEEEEEAGAEAEAGEWAEALYDYTSEVRGCSSLLSLLVMIKMPTFSSCDLCRKRAICIYKRGRGYS